MTISVTSLNGLSPFNGNIIPSSVLAVFSIMRMSRYEKEKTVITVTNDAKRNIWVTTVRMFRLKKMYVKAKGRVTGRLAYYSHATPIGGKHSPGWS